MKDKYLPIGTVCSIKGKNKKIMITGFYGVEFNGNFKINDYLGCVYPEGLLLPNSTCFFNHSDIEEILFMGFVNDDQRKFKNMLNKLTGNDDSNDYQKDDWSLASSGSYSKLLFDENGVVVLAEPVKETKKNSKINFDKDGFVISEETLDIENPFYKDYSNVAKKYTENFNSIFTKYEFDENGVVVSDKSNIDSKKQELLNKINFDENGFVISSKEEVEIKKVNRYEFDENGILISVEADEPVSTIESELPGYEEPVPPIGPGLPGYEEE